MLGAGTIKTIMQDNEVYVNLNQLCTHYTNSAIKIKEEASSGTNKDINVDYLRGVADTLYTVAETINELGIFEVQKRLIDTPEDLLSIIDNYGSASV